MNLNSEIQNRQEDIRTHSYQHAVIAGVGGIGSWVALDLALSGTVKTIHLIDPDSVESSNLNRTPFRLCDVGFPKVDALKYLILERRANVDVITYKDKTCTNQIAMMKSRIENDINFDRHAIGEIIDELLIIDCRDDVYEDLYQFNCKYYKVGYDGLSVTIDGNPRHTAVWGEANNYTFTPSFIAPSQMIASIVVTDAVAMKDLDEDFNRPGMDNISNIESFDLRGRINKTFTVDTRDIVATLYREYLEGNASE